MVVYVCVCGGGNETSWIRGMQGSLSGCSPAIDHHTLPGLQGGNHMGSSHPSTPFQPVHGLCRHHCLPATFPPHSQPSEPLQERRRIACKGDPEAAPRCTKQPGEPPLLEEGRQKKPYLCPLLQPQPALTLQLQEPAAIQKAMHTPTALFIAKQAGKQGRWCPLHNALWETEPFKWGENRG